MILFRRKVSLAAATALVLALALGPWVSLANHVDLNDANDTRGPLDVRGVSVGPGDAPRWSISTWGRWRAAEIWDTGFFVIKFDTFGDSHHDYYALVRSSGSRLVGSLHRDFVERRDRELRDLRVARPDRRSVRVKVPYRAMRFSQPGTYRWVVNSTFTSSRCGKAACLDRAPDEGAIDEPREPVPTPTVTATPTESPR